MPLIRGDGVGPELTAAACDVINAAGGRVDWIEAVAGRGALERYGTPLPDATVEMIRAAGCVLKGPLETRTADTHRSPNLELKARLGLFAQVRPIRSWAGVAAPLGPVDIVVIREVTEDLYAGIEFAPGGPDTRRLIQWLSSCGKPVPAAESGITVKAISDHATRRVARFAFDYARRFGRGRVTAVHKATVMRSTDGVFLRAARSVADLCPEIEFDDVLVDRLAMDLVRRPGRFDVLMLPNSYGDIISDLVAGLVGGTGLAPGAAFGADAAVFEAAHGTVRSRVGTGLANPIALVLSAAMLMCHLGEAAVAARVERAVAEVLGDGSALTSDLRRSSTATTKEVSRRLVTAIDRSEGSHAVRVC